MARKTKFRGKSAALHGDVSQKDREYIIKALHNGQIKHLIATNIAARGLDLPNIDLIV